MVLVIAGVAGCASDAGRVVEPVSDSKQFERPAWANQSYFRGEDGRHHFVGIGYGTSEAYARHEAQQDALALFATYMGAEVLTGARIRAKTRTDTRGIERDARVRDDFVGVSSQALIEAGTLTFKYDPSRSTAWAKLTLPDESVLRAKDSLQADYDAQAQQEAVRLRTLLKQRKQLAEGDTPTVVFGQASGQAVIRRNRRDSILAQHLDALERARYEAILKLNNQIHGVQVRHLISGDTTIGSQSAMVSVGRIHWEVVGERVWSLGDDINAQVTLFGWSRVERD